MRRASAGAHAQMIAFSTESTPRCPCRFRLARSMRCSPGWPDTPRRSRSPRPRTGQGNPCCEMIQDALDYRRVFDAGDDLDHGPTIRAGLHVNLENPLEPLRPSHRYLPLTCIRIGIRRSTRRCRAASSRPSPSKTSHRTNRVHKVGGIAMPLPTSALTPDRPQPADHQRWTLETTRHPGRLQAEGR